MAILASDSWLLTPGFYPATFGGISRAQPLPGQVIDAEPAILYSRLWHTDKVRMKLVH